ncbi:hypothetical protein B7494_g6781 [Chlorociboria aeruginascens]|nr:hypothetical protein B7494_g6781 [Chlorociboria aeruginascens]
MLEEEEEEEEEEDDDDEDGISTSTSTSTWNRMTSGLMNKPLPITSFFLFWHPLLPLEEIFNHIGPRRPPIQSRTHHQGRAESASPSIDDTITTHSSSPTRPSKDF